jgi:hypothetical protein
MLYYPEVFNSKTDWTLLTKWFFCFS